MANEARGKQTAVNSTRQYSISEKLFHESRGLMPAGNTRTATFYPPFPVALQRGAGYRVWDVDGNEYFDFLNNYTALVHGHGSPVISAAIESALRDGTVFPAPIRLQSELARRIQTRFPSIDLLRFCNSGTEAVMMAVRAARVFTGRDAILKAIGGFHGSWEQVAHSATEVEAGANSTDGSHERGIPLAVRNLVESVRYNDVEHLEHLMSTRGSEIAAILLEPVLGHVIEAGTLEFLAAAQRLAIKHGALLIFDEIITARLHSGGVQGELGLEPDLTTLGKIIGGGLPVAAFGGRKDIMALFDPEAPDSIQHHGTFNGNSLGMAAGCASLDLLTESEIHRINALGEALEAVLADCFLEAGLEVRITRAGSILNLHSTSLAELHRALLDEGVYIAPRGQMSISTPMDAAVIDATRPRVSRAADRVVNKMREGSTR